MILAAIFLFLTGAVLAWRFRVWILVPLCLLTIVSTLLLQLWLDVSALTACGNGFLLGVALQSGYGFGAVSRSALSMRFKQRRALEQASVDSPYEQSSVDGTR